MEKRVRDIWIERIGNPKLVGKEDPKFLKNYVVCGHHFSDLCKDTNERLLRFSLPTIKCPSKFSFYFKDFFTVDNIFSDYNGLYIRENCFSYPEEPLKPVTPEKVRG